MGDVGSHHSLLLPPANPAPAAAVVAAPALLL
jgi:hypothetical protein